jgi:uncharacterized protein
MMILRLLLAVIMICFAIKALVYLVRQIGPKRSKPAVERWNTAQGANEMVRDPVCGLYIPAQEALSLVKGGKAIHFCSERCLQRFISG